MERLRFLVFVVILGIPAVLMADTGFRPPGIIVSEADDDPVGSATHELVFPTNTVTINGTQAVIDTSQGGTRIDTVVLSGDICSILFVSTNTTLGQSQTDLCWDNVNKYLLIGGSTTANASISMSTTGAAVFNEQGVDADFSVEAVGVADALQVNGANGAITLGALGTGVVQSDANGLLSSAVLDHGSLGGLADDDHTQYLLESGARVGASSQAQDFTNGVTISADDTSLLAAGGAVFNENGNDTDFRIEGDTDEYLFVADAGNNHVAVGTGTTEGKFNVIGTANENTLFIRTTAGQTLGQAIKVENSAGVATFILNANGGMDINAAANNSDTTIRGNAEVFMLFDASQGVIGVKKTINIGSTFDLNGSFGTPVNTITTDYTATITDYSIRCDTSGGDITVTLPTAVGITGRWYAFKKVTTDSNRMIIDGNGTETIDGDLTYSTRLRYTAIMLQSNGTNWDIY